MPSRPPGHHAVWEDPLLPVTCCGAIPTALPGGGRLAVCLLPQGPGWVLSGVACAGKWPMGSVPEASVIRILSQEPPPWATRARTP